MRPDISNCRACHANAGQREYLRRADVPHTSQCAPVIVTCRMCYAGRRGGGDPFARVAANRHDAGMTPMLARARALWTGLANAPVSFRTDGTITAVNSPDSRMCPPGWAGLVVLGGAGIATVPRDDLIPIVEGLPITAAASPSLLRAHVRAEILGPASLAYLDQDNFRPVGGDITELGDEDLAAFLQTMPLDDADESGLTGITSPAYAVHDGLRVLAVAGYRRWPHGTAHLSVLTAPGARGRGLARVAASAAVAVALTEGLLPQWRARPEPSRRVAAALGFTDLGTQVSLRFD